jgi:hypothetical protein
LARVVTAPYQRRRDPQPISQGWEVAVVAITSVLVVVALAAVAGLGLASALAGGGWVWPHGNDAIGHVVGGILTGHPGRGLDVRQSRLAASPTFAYIGIAACEIAAIGMSVVVGVVIARYRRPMDARSGMASRGEATQVLGLSRLRSARTIIRPDRYPSRHERAQ